MPDTHTSESYKALSYSITEFDKSIVYIASGSLGISMSVIDKIVPLQVACNKIYLMYSWYFFGGTIFISLITHFISVIAIRWSIKNCPHEDADDTIFNLKCEQWNLTIRVSNMLMIFTLFVGLAAMLVFIHTNIIN